MLLCCPPHPPPQGFCLPQELAAGGDGEGATEFHDYEGGGIGEGEGTKDVSDKIENEDQVIPPDTPICSRLSKTCREFKELSM